MSQIYDLLVNSGCSGDIASWGVVIFFSFALLCIFFAFKRFLQGK